MLLAQAERRLGIAGQLARVIPDERPNTEASAVFRCVPPTFERAMWAFRAMTASAASHHSERIHPALSQGDRLALPQ